MKRLLTSTALVAALAFPALAQESGTMAASPFVTSAAATDLRASEFIGTRVFTSETDLEDGYDQGVNENWNGIGEINDVLLTPDGTIDAILVDVGGFLGIGEKTVAVSMAELQLMSEGDDPNNYFVVFTSSREALENAPAYVEPEVAAAQDTGLETGESTDPLTSAETAAPGAMTADPDADPVADAQPDQGMTTAPETEMAEGSEAMSDPAITEGNTAPDMAEAPSGESGFVAPEVQREGFAEAKAEMLNTETLTGARVYDVNDEWIGEIAELMVDDQGKITDAVIDVGGFLGLGEKPVSMNFDALNVLHQTDGEEVRVYLDVTEEELEALPRHETTQ